MASIRKATEGAVHVPRTGGAGTIEEGALLTTAVVEGRTPSGSARLPTSVLKSRGVQINGGMATDSVPAVPCGGKGTKMVPPPDTGRRMGATVDHPFYEPHGEHDPRGHRPLHHPV